MSHVNADDIRSLLPLYAAHSLDDAERKVVEEALAASPELREELRFWRTARLAAIIHSQLHLNHLTPEQIVGIVAGTIEDPQERTNIRKHLASCPSCTGEESIIRAIHSDGDHLPKPEMARRTRWVYAAAALLIVTLTLLVLSLPGPEQHAINVEATGPDTVAPQPTARPHRTVTLTLQAYDPMRAAAAPNHRTPGVTLDSTTDTLVVTFLVQSSGISNVYAVSVRRDVMVLLRDTVRTRLTRDGFDHLVFTIPAARLHQAGAYTVDAAEILGGDTRWPAPQTSSGSFEIGREESTPQH